MISILNRILLTNYVTDVSNYFQKKFQSSFNNAASRMPQRLKRGNIKPASDNNESSFVRAGIQSARSKNCDRKRGSQLTSEKIRICSQL